MFELIIEINISKGLLQGSLCFQNMICFYFAETAFFNGADKDRCCHLLQGNNKVQQVLSINPLPSH